MIRAQRRRSEREWCSVRKRTANNTVCIIIDQLEGEEYGKCK